MKYTVVIADDEPLAREKLRHFLSEEPDFEVVGEASNGSDALDCARKLNPDVIVLDVQMPPLDGLEVAFGLGDHTPVIVVTTAHRDHAVEAFSANAADYVLKPYSQSRFKEALARARQRLVARPGAADEPPPRTDRLLVKSRGRYVVVHTDTIEWLEAAANYVVLHTQGGNHVVRGTLAETLVQLGDEFFYRAGRSTAVNLGLINEVLMDAPGEHTIVMRSGAKVRLQRSFRELQTRIEQRRESGGVAVEAET